MALWARAAACLTPPGCPTPTSSPPSSRSLRYFTVNHWHCLSWPHAQYALVTLAAGAGAAVPGLLHVCSHTQNPDTARLQLVMMQPSLNCYATTCWPSPSASNTARLCSWRSCSPSVGCCRAPSAWGRGSASWWGGLGGWTSCKPPQPRCTSASTPPCPCPATQLAPKSLMPSGCCSHACGLFPCCAACIASLSSICRAALRSEPRTLPISEGCKAPGLTHCESGHGG